MVFFPVGYYGDFIEGAIVIQPDLELDVVALFFDDGGVGSHPSDLWMESNVYSTNWGGVAWRSLVFSLDAPEFPWCSMD